MEEKEKEEVKTRKKKKERYDGKRKTRITRKEENKKKGTVDGRDRKIGRKEVE